MKLVITIDDDIYDDYLKQGATLPKYGTEIDSLYKALWNGVPLPKGHGRLIDADALMKSYSQFEFCSDMGDAMEILDNVPSIIEGSDSE